MKLYTLFYGKKKNGRKKAIMTDSMEKCRNYQKAREHTVPGFHEIKEAEPDAEQWRQKLPKSGYIGKNGFNPHT